MPATAIKLHKELHEDNLLRIPASWDNTCTCLRKPTNPPYPYHSIPKQGPKLAHYKRIPSLKHILLVDQDEPYVSVYSRTETPGQWLNKVVIAH